MWQNYLRYKHAYHSIVILLLFVSCTSKQAEQPLNFTDMLLLSNISSFDITATDTNNHAVNWYYSSYFSVIPNLQIHSGYYPSNGELLVAHMFTGANTDKGTVIIIHGYTGGLRENHFKYFTQQFIKRGYRVIGLDLPGHEFSGGYRSSIKKFEDYGTMLLDFLAQNQGQLGSEVNLLGFSVGATAIFDAAQRNPLLLSTINKTALLVPFIKMKNSGWLAFGSAFTYTVRSRNEGPLEIYNISTVWIRKQREWEKAMRKNASTITDNSIFIAFAEKDKVIDYPAAIKFYTEKVPNATIVTYEGEDHNITKEHYQKFRNDVMAFF